LQYPDYQVVFPNEGRSLGGRTTHIGIGEAANLALRHQPRLLSFIRKRVQSDEDAEDILQDVFYHFLSNYSIAQPIEQLSAGSTPLRETGS
jgi:hypothetical protein